jgi:hypothetical protein
MRSISVSITGLTASATAVSLSQSVPGAAAVVVDGALASGYSATSVATTTSNGAGTTAVTLNGSLVTGGVAYLPVPKQIVLVSAGNDSAKTWTVRGIGPDNYTAQTETVTAANTSRTATTKTFSQVFSVTLSAGSAGNVSVGVNGTATITQPRRISFTSAGTDTGDVFTVTGTDVNGNAQIENVTGGSAGVVAYTALSYKTISSIVSSGATASTLTVGTAADSISGGAAASRWVRLDGWAPSYTSIQCTVSGTVNYTVQSSLDDPTSPTNAVDEASMVWVDSSDADVVGASTTKQSNFIFSPVWARVVLNSGSGTVTASFTQSSNVPY